MTTKKAPKKSTQAPKTLFSETERKKLINALEFDHEAKVDSGDGSTYGLLTGQKLTHYLNGLFWAAYDAEWTDAELKELMESEFPNRNCQSISAYRSYYNGGKHGHGWLNDEGKIEAPESPLVRRA